MSDDLLDARRHIKQRPADVDDKVDRADPPKGRDKKSSSSSGRRATTADQAKRTEHKGDKGQRSFGTPMSTGAAEKAIDKARKRQTTDSNNK